VRTGRIGFGTLSPTSERAMETFPERVAKHARITWLNMAPREVPSPRFLILFINSICNMKCEHCFYWQQLNQKDDLSFEELVKLSEDLGPIQNLNLSGGEPFLRKEFGPICRQFIRHNGVKEIYTPSNGYFTDKTVKAVRDVLQEPSLNILTVELSLDGMPKFHDEFRKARNAFRNAMRTYDALAELQEEDSRLQIHAVSTATEWNMSEIRQLTTYLYDRCPKMMHHNLAIIRGDRKNPTLGGPKLQEYKDLYEYIRRLWAPREEVRYGSLVEPMLQHAKLESVERKTQYVPCRAGVLSAVVHANGDVGVCEQRPPIGNLRQHSFMEIWRSQSTGQVRKSIRDKECYCTNEVFMWPSIVFQPTQLAKSMVGAKVWQRAEHLPDDERVDYAEAAAVLQDESNGSNGDEPADASNGGGDNGFTPVALPVVQPDGTEGTH
jgi:MoaA/NifB/PqqE/SkfB family radical SAM enzyme